jgi:hypothetical protein
MSFLSKVELKKQLQALGINVEGNYVKKSDIEKSLNNKHGVKAQVKRQEALEYIGHVLDDSGKKLAATELDKKNATLVGWQCGFEPMYVAVNTDDPEEAEEIAIRYLQRIKWFSGEEKVDDFGSSHKPDFIIESKQEQGYRL